MLLALIFQQKAAEPAMPKKSDSSQSHRRALENALPIIGLHDAWNLTRGEASVRVAVVDVATDAMPGARLESDLRRIAPGCCFHSIRLPGNSPNDTTAQTLLDLSLYMDVIACRWPAATASESFASLLRDGLASTGSHNMLRKRSPLLCFEDTSFPASLPVEKREQIPNWPEAFQDEIVALFSATLYPAGLAALLMSANPAIGVREVRTILLASREESAADEANDEIRHPGERSNSRLAERWNAAVAVAEAIRRRT